MYDIQDLIKINKLELLDDMKKNLIKSLNIYNSIYNDNFSIFKEKINELIIKNINKNEYNLILLGLLVLIYNSKLNFKTNFFLESFLISGKLKSNIIFENVFFYIINNERSINSNFIIKSIKIYNNIKENLKNSNSLEYHWIKEINFLSVLEIFNNKETNEFAIFCKNLNINENKVYLIYKLLDYKFNYENKNIDNNILNEIIVSFVNENKNLLIDNLKYEINFKGLDMNKTQFELNPLLYHINLNTYTTNYIKFILNNFDLKNYKYHMNWLINILSSIKDFEKFNVIFLIKFILFYNPSPNKIFILGWILFKYENYDIYNNILNLFSEYFHNILMNNNNYFYFSEILNLSEKSFTKYPKFSIDILNNLIKFKTKSKNLLNKNIYFLESKSKIISNLLKFENLDSNIKKFFANIINNDKYEYNYIDNELQKNNSIKLNFNYELSTGLIKELEEKKVINNLDNQIKIKENVKKYCENNDITKIKENNWFLVLWDISIDLIESNINDYYTYENILIKYFNEDSDIILILISNNLENSKQIIEIINKISVNFKENLIYNFLKKQYLKCYVNEEDYSYFNNIIEKVFKIFVLNTNNKLIIKEFFDFLLNILNGLFIWEFKEKNVLDEIMSFYIINFNLLLKIDKFKFTLIQQNNLSTILDYFIINYNNESLLNNQFLEQILEFSINNYEQMKILLINLKPCIHFVINSSNYKIIISLINKMLISSEKDIFNYINELLIKFNTNINLIEKIMINYAKIYKNNLNNFKKFISYCKDIKYSFLKVDNKINNIILEKLDNLFK